MKRILAKCLTSLAGLASLAFAPSVASAAPYVPPSQICFYNGQFALLNPLCPPVSANPVGFAGGTQGLSATAWNNSVGINIHSIYSEYNSNPAKLLSILQYLNINHVRDGLSILPGSGTAQNVINTLGAAGIKSELILNTSYKNNPSKITTDLGSINAAQDVEALEGPNEQDLANDSSWANNNAQTMQTIWAWKVANQPSWKVVGPSLGGFNSYGNMGDLSAYEDYGNSHDYGAGFYPENPGYGGPGYGGFLYGGIDYNFANSKQASVSRPIQPTEFGAEINGASKNNTVDPGAQATFLLRQIFAHNARGSPRSYIYELTNSGGQNYGLNNPLGAFGGRPGYTEFAGFMNILKDSGTYNGNCAVPAAITDSGVSSFGVCFSDGRYALVAWQPVAGWIPAPNLGAYQPVTTINSIIQYSPGFLPSSTTQWSYPLNGDWSNSGAITNKTVPITDRPSVIMFNGSVTPTPLPTPPPS